MRRVIRAAAALVHRVDLDAGVVERQDLLGLKTVSEKTAGQRLPDDERDRRVTGCPRVVIRIDGEAMAWCSPAVSSMRP